MNNKYKYYLEDLGLLIVEKARKVKADFDALPPGPDKDYYMGQLMGYHCVVSLMQQQAFGFEIPLNEINLHTVNPEKDLL